MNGQMEKVAVAFGEYFVHRFVKECAARGITFSNEEELQAAIETSQMLQQCEKTAQANGIAPVSPKIAAHRMLKQAMAELEQGAQPVAPEAVQGIHDALVEASRATA